MSTTSREYHERRPQDPGRSRRPPRSPKLGGENQKNQASGRLSISDDSHHVTEAIGDMYGANQFSDKRGARPLSFVASSSAPTIASPLASTPLNEPTSSAIPSTPSITTAAATARSSPPRIMDNTSRSPQNRSELFRQPPGERSGIMMAHGQRIGPLSRSRSSEEEQTSRLAIGSGGDGTSSVASPSPSPSLSPSNSLSRQHSVSDTVNAHFPLNDIDYESNPNAIAQELHNLSALRRMSMDVNASGDPDLPSFSSNFGIPTPPPAGADPDDTARLYWVPASVHPELAPMEFETFLEKKVKSIKRRSEEKAGKLSPNSPSRDNSLSSLQRRRSMLSRQIDNTDGRGAEGYQDGAERLDRRRSQDGSTLLGSGMNNLHDLATLVNEPDRALRRLSLETNRNDTRISEDSLEDGDIPIIAPPLSATNSLKRSTRTTYRRGGSLRRGERAPFSKRAAQLAANTVSEESGDLQNPRAIDPDQRPTSNLGGLSRTQSEPSHSPPSRGTSSLSAGVPPDDITRTTKSNRRAGVPLNAAARLDFKKDDNLDAAKDERGSEDRPRSLQPRPFVSQIASNGRLGMPLGKQAVAPLTKSLEYPSSHSPASRPATEYHPPERTSSHAHAPLNQKTNTSAQSIPGSNQDWHSQLRNNQNRQPHQSLNDMASHPSPRLGNDTRTDTLSFIPTLTEERKADPPKKLKEAKKDKDGEMPRKSSWSWGSLLGSEEKEKEKDRDKEKKREEDASARDAKKTKAKVGKHSDKAHDNTRLDLLQSTLDANNVRGRESLVLDRGNLKLEEERKKESARKMSGPDAKKDKEAGFFSTLLGGAKRKGEREATMRKQQLRHLSPDPPLSILKPDIDFNWTRFSILEERAIYRMAHIKLANPRRALQSQVLLSNFMYSYLAKVQQMHPQANIPQRGQATSQAQKDQPEEFSQYQKYQEQQQQRQQQMSEEQHSSHSQNHDPSRAMHSLAMHERSFTNESNSDTYDYDYDHMHDDSGYEDSHHLHRAPAHHYSERDDAAGLHWSRQGSSYASREHDPGGANGAGGESVHYTVPYAYQQGQFDHDRAHDDNDMW